MLRLDEQPNSKNRSFSTAKKVQGTFRSLAWALSYGVFVFEISGLDVRKSFGKQYVLHRGLRRKNHARKPLTGSTSSAMI